MNINFNINDTLDAAFIAAAKWTVNEPTWTDDKCIKKYLKGCIGQLIDQYNKQQAIGALQTELDTLRTQTKTLQAEIIAKQVNANNAIATYDQTAVPTDMGPDA